MVTTTNQVNLVQVCSLNIEQSRLLQYFPKGQKVDRSWSQFQLMCLILSSNTSPLLCQATTSQSVNVHIFAFTPNTTVLQCQNDPSGIATKDSIQLEAAHTTDETKHAWTTQSHNSILVTHIA